MPYIMKKVRGKNCWSVRNKYTKKVFAKCSSKDDANKQLRLLRALEFNKSFKFRPRTASRRGTMRQKS